MKRKLQIIAGSLILISSICFFIVYSYFDNKLKLQNEEIVSKRMIEDNVKQNLLESRTYYFATKNTEEHIKILTAVNKIEEISKLEKDVIDNYKVCLESAFSSAKLSNGELLTQDEVRKKHKLIYGKNSRKEIEEAILKYLIDAKNGFNNLEIQIMELNKQIASIESKKNILYLIAFLIQAAGMFVAIISENYENK